MVYNNCISIKPNEGTVSPTMDKVSVLLVGIGGYGMTYVHHILDGNDPRIEVAGLVDPYPQSCTRLQEFTDAGVKLYGSMEAFFADGGKAQLAVLSTPIQFHTPQILLALEHGMHVLCEKPLCGDARDIEVLEKAAKEAGKYVGIGFQWSHNSAILALKRDVTDGKYGSREDLRTLVLWPRDAKYYSRGIGWAGKKTTPDGRLIYDSVINNATAHYLHNIFFVLGGDGTAVMPESIQAELYRANPIENFDTAKVDMTFPGGAQAHMLAAHAVNETVNPIFEYRFEKGIACYAKDDTPATRALMPEWYTAYGHIQAKFSDGSIVDYGNPFDDQCSKLTMAVDAVLSGDTKTVCGIATAAVHTRVIDYIQNNFEITDFAADELRKKELLTYADGLAQRMIAAYKDPTKRIGRE